jgi:hypothetical protein
MRADQVRSCVEVSANGRAVFRNHHGYHAGRPARTTRFELPVGTFSGWSARWENNERILVGRPRGWSEEATAIVPTVPAALRPKASLERFCILWEAIWQREPPRDPMLLKPLGWPFFAVVAVWDLTELERAVLRGRIG